MNFYIGNSIKEIDISEFNIKFDEDLLEYIYKKRVFSLIDLSTLYNIDPYDDVEISVKSLSKLIEICNYLLESKLLLEYADYDSAITQLKALHNIAKESIKKGIGLVSIGD